MMTMNVEHLDATPDGMWPVHIRAKVGLDDGSTCLLHAAADRGKVEHMILYAYDAGVEFIKGLAKVERREGYDDGYREGYAACAKQADNIAKAVIDPNPWVAGDGSLSPAEFCRQHGWVVGDRIERKGLGRNPSVITAIGEWMVLWRRPDGLEDYWSTAPVSNTAFRKVAE